MKKLEDICIVTFALDILLLYSNNVYLFGPGLVVEGFSLRGT